MYIHIRYGNDITPYWQECCGTSHHIIAMS